MIKKMTAGFDGLMRKYTPDPFIYALSLTALVFLLGVFVAKNPVLELAQHWGQGFWSLATFTLQMAMILLLGYVVALAPVVKRILSRLSHLPTNLNQAAVFTTVISLIGSIINWGFGLIISALFCKQLGQRFRGKKFSVLVACSYSGFLVWHGGLSGSIPLVVSTPGNFAESLIGRTVPLSETIFSPLNLSILLGHFIALPILNYFLMRWHDDDRSVAIIPDNDIVIDRQIGSPAEALENSQLAVFMIVFLALLYWMSHILSNTISIDLNQINFIFFVLALVLHKTPRGFLDASNAAAQKIWPILVQFPLYAGIMAIMQKSGLAEILSNLFITVASAKTLPFLVYLSAGLINIFIPSGGGQWAVQGPLVINAASELSADLNASMMAVAWGDAWTNMIQPFWALPLLAIAGLKAKDIMAPLVFVFLASGIITAGCFLIF